ncbi:MAG TPA: DNA-processing protein DprA [Solirubrobacteraceae bacterium]|nr:DNA-processing protein DprA [Solirubrobacteraceae bacterium]
MNEACAHCERRRRLLGSLSARLDYRARDPERFWRLLELADSELIDAIGGRRREELHRAYMESSAGTDNANASIDTLCRHSRGYPPGLQSNALAPHALAVRGAGARLAGMLREKVVAIVGTRRATDYGMETARALARDLAVSGVTVASGLSEGIATAAHAGALEAGRPTLTVLASGLDRAAPASCRALCNRIVESGCAISEAPATLPSHYWAMLAGSRTLALLAGLTIVVEAEDRPSELACAHVTQALGKPVAAVPGRLTSSASRGTNLLLMGGAHLIRDSRDALDLLHGAGANTALDPEPEHESEPEIEVDPRLRTVLDRVGAGEDTLPRLMGHDNGTDGLMLALVELELRGLLLRGDGGRYVVGAGARAVQPSRRQRDHRGRPRRKSVPHAHRHR